MALIQSTAIPSGATDYEIDQSLRFNDDDSAYLSWTPSSAGNRKTWTWSGWVKRGNIGFGNIQIFGAGTGPNADNQAYIVINEAIEFFEYEPAYNFRKVTTQVFRDASAWYHILVAFDTTDSTADDRIKIYVNGIRVTSFSTSVNPSLNHDSLMINTANGHQLGAFWTGGANFDGYLAEVNFIDGQAKVASDFGETGDYGEWKPIEYSGTYGTNGFYLNFAGGGIMSATGGNSTATDGDYKAASFTANGTFTPSADGYVEYLVIGGGGGAGSGGGGAGGYRTGYLPVTASTAYSITVGSGGTSHTTSSNGGAGANSIFSSITSIGGGYGAGADPAPGGVGGSGGGGGGGNSSVVGGGQNNPGGAATSGQGNAGGYGYTDASSYGIGGGGGGAGSAGSNASSGGPAGNGGNGLANSITGSSVTYAGGGGGGGAIGSGTKNGGSGGTGGGGAGGNGSATGTAGTANTGGGGGGGGASSSGGAGGSGIVIIRYKFQ